MSKNQRLNATITIGSVLEGSVKRNIGVLKSGLNQVGDAIKQVERRQKELDRQRNVLRRQGQSVEHLDREYEKLEARLKALRRAQERWNRAAAASRRVGATFRDLASSIGRIVRQLTIGAGLAGGALFGLASSTAQLGDNVAKTADKLGIGTAALQELRYAAERSGVSTSEFDTSLEKMLKNLGEAATGTGTAKDALEQLGLSAEQLITMSPEDALGLIADRMEGVGTQAEKAAIANDIFGRSGIGMINMLRDGSNGLAQLRDDARRTGYVLSEKAARDAEVFQDTLLDTQLVLKGLKNTVGAELMPVVTHAMRRVGDALIENRDVVKQWADAFADGAERALPKIGDVLTGIGQVGSVVWGVVEGTAEMVGGWKKFGIIIGTVLASRTIVRVGKFGAAVFRLGKAMIGLIRAGPLVVGAIRAIGTALMMNPIGLAAIAIAGAALLIWKNWEPIKAWFSGLWSDVQDSFSGFTTFLGSVWQGDFEGAVEGAKQSWTGFKGVFNRNLWLMTTPLRQSYNGVIKPIMDKLGLTEPIGNAWEKVKDTIGSAVQAIKDKFTAVWEKIEPVITGLTSTENIGAAWDTVKAALDPLLTWLGKKFETVMTFIQPVIDALKWGLNNAARAGTAIGDAAGRAVTGYVDPGKVSGLGAAASGGNAPRMTDEQAARLYGPSLQQDALGGAFRPGWHLTGELGPELTFENRSGYVANNRAMRQLAGYADRVGTILAHPRTPQRRSGMSARVDALFGQAAGASGAMASPNQVTQNITYTINAAGASAEEVIRLVERKSRQAAGNGLFDRAASIGPYGR